MSPELKKEGTIGEMMLASFLNSVKHLPADQIVARLVSVREEMAREIEENDEIRDNPDDLSGAMQTLESMDRKIAELRSQMGS